RLELSAGGQEPALDHERVVEAERELDDLSGVDGEGGPRVDGDPVHEVSDGRVVPGGVRGDRAVVEHGAVGRVVREGKAGEHRAGGDVHADGGAEVVQEGVAGHGRVAALDAQPGAVGVAHHAVAQGQPGLADVNGARQVAAGVTDDD